MALQKTYTQITWPGDSTSVSAGGDDTSEVMTPLDDTIHLSVMAKADNSAGSPSSGDKVEVYLQRTLGDPDGSGSDEFATDNHSELVLVLDTNLDDPAVAVNEIPIGGKDYQFFVKNLASANAITVSIEVEEVNEA